MAGEGTGWGGEFHLHDGTQLVELEGVTSIGLPEESVDEEDVTTLKSEGRYKEFIATLRDGGSFDVEMNYIPGSDTDVLCRAAAAAMDSRAWKTVIPAADGTAERQYTGNAAYVRYRPGDLTPGSAKKATLTVRVSGAPAEAAAS